MQSLRVSAALGLHVYVCGQVICGGPWDHHALKDGPRREKGKVGGNTDMSSMRMRLRGGQHRNNLLSLESSILRV